MKGFIRLFILTALITTLTSCASQPIEDDLSMEEGEAATAAAADSGSGDEFADFEEEAPAGGGETSQAQTVPPSNDDDLSIEDEFNSADGNPPQQQAEAPLDAPVEPPMDVPAEDPFANNVADAPAPTPPIEEPPMAQTIPAPTPEPPPAVSAPATEMANITDLKYQGNDSGGTIVVQGDQPLNFTTRSNPENRQFVIEVENARLPDRLKRSFNTRDIQGNIGAIDAYQNPGSTTARFVIQLRPGVSEPTVQAEGRSLLIVTNNANNGAPSPVVSEGFADAGGTVTGSDSGRILPSADLAGFLAGNTQFYGKKISVETNNMDIRDALHLITEESGVNMVISDEVRGPISLKLRQVPWDQALVVIMKAKKLGYSRQGNVLRIAPLADLKAEEDDATKLAASRRTVEPLKVRMFPVSYARVDDLEKKIKDFLGERGRVVGDVRTNALVVTDIEENLNRVAKLISNLDTQPAQVLIEGKLVEAQENFERTIGVQWGLTGSQFRLGRTPRGPLNLTPSLTVNPGAGGSGQNLNLNIALGTLDMFGTLQAALALAESENKAKVISAPRIMTMTNETASINQTTEVPVRQVSQSVSGTVETFTFKPLTLRLEVTPQVTADGSVIMKVAVDRQFQTADQSTSAVGAFAVNSRQANTRVLVKNGQTAVVGGIYQSDAVESRNGVPGLKDVPFLGSLFRASNERRLKTELLVFLTPRIVSQDNGVAADTQAQDF